MTTAGQIVVAELQVGAFDPIAAFAAAARSSTQVGAEPRTTTHVDAGEIVTAEIQVGAFELGEGRA